MSEFIYLLNAFEQASQSPMPSTMGYADKRKALLEYVANLETRGVEASQGDSKPLIRAVRRLCERIRQAPVDEFLPEFIVVEAMIDASPKNAAPQVPEVREARGDGARVQPPGRSNYEAGEPLSQNTQSATPAGAASRGSSAEPQAWQAVGWYDKTKDVARWEPGREPPHGALLYRPASRGYVPQEDGSRESFERWLVETYDSNADFDVARNCYKEFAVHMAWQAWRAR